MSLFKNVKKTTSGIATSSVPKSLNTSNMVVLNKEMEPVKQASSSVSEELHTDDTEVVAVIKKPVAQKQAEKVQNVTTSSNVEFKSKTPKQAIRTIVPPVDISSNPVLDTMYKKLGGTIKIAGYDKPSTYNFGDMPLDRPILDAIYRVLKFELASPIQSTAIGPVLDRRDILCQGQAGTGKTLSYGVPAVQNVLTDRKTGVKKGCKVIILTPTRELTDQSFDLVSKLCTYTDISVAAHIGGRGPTRDERGVNYSHNVKPDDPKLKMYSVPEYSEDIVIATPGRIWQLLSRGNIDCKDINLVVLDEADKMLQQNFMESIINIFTKIEQSSQTQIQVALYSATYSPEIQMLAEKFMQNPVKILVSTENVVTDNQNQYIENVQDETAKAEVLNNIFSIPGINQVIVFCNRIYVANHVTEQLKQLGLSVGCIHSELTQQERDLTMNDFKSGRLKIMVGTDVIARGIDTNVSLVINYDIPKDVESYVHRIGRTGRFGKDGDVVNIVSQSDLEIIKRIIKFYRIKMMPMSKFAEAKGLVSKILR